MTLGAIYAFKDRDFARGIKIGRDSNFPDRFRKAQCYTPRGIDLVAVWRIDRGFRDLAHAEQIARTGLPRVASVNGGAEWCDLDSKEAIARVSANLCRDPQPMIGNPRITTTYDDFRDPKVLKGTERHRQVLWVYRENQTGLLKVQRTASWKVPLEPVKTYSLLGFRPIAAFIASSTIELATANRMAHETWETLVVDHGHGIGHTQVGWLQPKIDATVVTRDIERRGLKQLSDLRTCPPDVRAGY